MLRLLRLLPVRLAVDASPASPLRGFARSTSLKPKPALHCPLPPTAAPSPHRRIPRLRSFAPTSPPMVWMIRCRHLPLRRRHPERRKPPPPPPICPLWHCLPVLLPSARHCPRGRPPPSPHPERKLPCYPLPLPMACRRRLSPPYSRSTLPPPRPPPRVLETCLPCSIACPRVHALLGRLCPVLGSVKERLRPLSLPPPMIMPFRSPPPPPRVAPRVSSTCPLPAREGRWLASRPMSLTCTLVVMALIRPRGRPLPSSTR